MTKISIRVAEVLRVEGNAANVTPRWAVLGTRDLERRDLYVSIHGLHTAQAAASAMRTDAARHGDYVSAFDAAPLVSPYTSKSGREWLRVAD